MLLFSWSAPCVGLSPSSPCLYFVSRLIPTPNSRRHKMSGSAFPHAPSADEAGPHACFLKYFDLRSSGSSLYDGSIVNEANWVLTEAPERLKESHRAFYRWTQAGESIAYGSSGELRVGRCDLGVFVTSSKVSRHLEGS